MIGIVVVSHSRKLAEGIVELAGQMTLGKIAMEAVGGIDDPENPIGTDPMQVLAAIETVAGQAEDGVLVIMDLGSALMSAETALEFLADEIRAKVQLCSAPVVEGTVAAAVQASVGAGLKEAAAEASAALGAKIQQLAPITGETVEENRSETKDELVVENDVHTLELTIHNRLGLHARPAAHLVAEAGRFKSTIQLKKGDQIASAKSINQVALLAVKQGDTILVSSSGPDAEQALAAIQALHKDNFGERDEDLSAVTGPRRQESGREPVVEADGSITGLAGSDGCALGPVQVYQTVLPKIARRECSDIPDELERLKQAISLAADEVNQLREKAEKRSGSGAGDIFKAHGLILEDQDLYDQAAAIIEREKVCAEYGWKQVIAATAQAYRELDSEYMQVRAADVLDCGGRVLYLLSGVKASGVQLAEPAILLADDLSPSDAAALDPEMVLGLVLQTGTVTSHAAILARSLGIPAVMGLPIRDLEGAATLALDGGTGKVWVDPSDEVQNQIISRREAWIAGREQAKASGMKPATTMDGTQIPVMGNIGGPADAAGVLAFGADGVGLFRTEFLFQDRPQAPEEHEQLAAYLLAAKNMEGKPVIIRTLDIGGDKPVPYLQSAVEANPFLGERGIRFCMARKELFRTQLRALLRAAAEENIRIMYPMIASVDELQAALQLQQEVQDELVAEGLDPATRVKTGIMIEVPAAAAEADKLARYCDFFSIGTNDLTQYVMAADRGNQAVVELCDSLHPAVLRMIKMSCDAGREAGIEVGMCGELAADSTATPLLLGLGITELSMSGPAISAVKQAVSAMSLEQCRFLAEEALAAETPEQVRDLLDLFNMTAS